MRFTFMSLTCIFSFSNTSVCCNWKLWSVCRLDMSILRALKLPKTPKGCVWAKWLRRKEKRWGGEQWNGKQWTEVDLLEMCFCAAPVRTLGVVHSWCGGHYLQFVVLVEMFLSSLYMDPLLPRELFFFAFWDCYGRQLMDRRELGRERVGKKNRRIKIETRQERD